MLGISIYPGQKKLSEILSYIDLAAQYGYGRIFTCLISEEGRSLQEVVADFRQITARARQHHMEIIADVAPQVFTTFGVRYDDLKFFADLGLSGIRLDLGYSGIEESIMSLNPYGLSIELNMSQGTRMLENILAQKPNKARILGCHNFYPHVYTGLGYEHFITSSRQFRQQGIRTAAFVNAPGADHGPWPVREGLCTLEMHRDLPIEVQAKHLFATGLIDDVIIANAFATEEELRTLAAVSPDILELRVETIAGISAVEKKILFDELHFNRGDVSDYMIRSTQPRVKYKGEEFPAWHTPELEPGDVVIESSLYDRYAGELQIVRQSMPNSGKSNVVARVVPQEHFLLASIQPWTKFRFQGAVPIE